MARIMWGANKNEVEKKIISDVDSSIIEYIRLSKKGRSIQDIMGRTKSDRQEVENFANKYMNLGILDIENDSLIINKGIKVCTIDIQEKY